MDLVELVLYFCEFSWGLNFWGDPWGPWKKHILWGKMMFCEI